MADVDKAYDYKSEIKKRIAWLKSQGRPLTLKRIAERIGVQYTYLSKILNSVSLHLGEDDIFAIAQQLELHPHEIELWLLMRSYCGSVNADRKKLLWEALERAQASQIVSAEIRPAHGIGPIDE